MRKLASHGKITFSCEHERKLVCAVHLYLMFTYKPVTILLKLSEYFPCHFNVFFLYYPNSSL